MYIRFVLNSQMEWIKIDFGQAYKYFYSWYLKKEENFSSQQWMVRVYSKCKSEYLNFVYFNLNFYSKL